MPPAENPRHCNDRQEAHGGKGSMTTSLKGRLYGHSVPFKLFILSPKATMDYFLRYNSI